MSYIPNDLLQRLIGRRINAVLFSMDYVHLWFDGDTPSGGNVRIECDVYPVVKVDGRTWQEPDAGYGDALRSFIPSEVVATSELSGDGLVVSFAAGQIVINPTWDELVGPEIATLIGFADHEWMCWRPGEESFEHLASRPE